MKTKARRTSRSTTTVHRPVSRARHHKVKHAIKQKRTPLGKFFMHPTSMFATLLVGVLLVGLTLQVIAADILTVTATVPAPPLTEAATIESPQDGITVSSAQTSVMGTCPDNSYVSAYRNGVFAGTAVCVGQAYSIPVTLVKGGNTLVVQAYNSTDQPGPSTPSITITYVPPVTSPDHLPNQLPNANDNGELGHGGSSSGGALPFIVWTQFHFAVFDTLTDYRWSMHVEGGASPYSVRVNWGDSKSTTKHVTDESPFSVTHRYRTPGYYPIVVTATDSQGRVAVVQLAGLIKNPGAAGTIGSILAPPTVTTTQGPSFWQSHRWLLVAWPAYLLVLLMTVSFWLGERREYLLLVRPGQSNRPRHV